MMNSHPKEKEIQEYVLDRSSCTADIIGHIESCNVCQEEVNGYTLLFSELKEEPTSNFDFDVAELVMSQLPSPKPGMSTDRFIFGFLVIFTCLCIAVPVYVFWQNILYMFSDIPVYFIYAIIGSSASILVIKILSLFKKYQGQMRILNFTYSS